MTAMTKSYKLSKCSFCSKTGHSEDRCFTKFPELLLQFQENRRKTKGKQKGKGKGRKKGTGTKDKGVSKKVTTEPAATNQVFSLNVEDLRELLSKPKGKKKPS